MKKNKSHIIGAWLLLILFVGSQVILFAHQHKQGQSTGYTSHGPHAPQQTVTEKCQLCDALHFNIMVVNYHPVTTHLLVATHYDYKAVIRTFISLSLILSPGRAPPVS